MFIAGVSVFTVIGLCLISICLKQSFGDDSIPCSVLEDSEIDLDELWNLYLTPSKEELPPIKEVIICSAKENFPSEK